MKTELWDAVRHDPDDDAALLVLADWLGEQGQTARAELIRTQVAHAALDPLDADRVALEVRSQQLLQANAETWNAELSERPVRWGGYERGFVRHMTFDDPQQWHDLGADCLDATLVHSVSLPWARLGEVEVLPAHPQLRTLDVRGTIVSVEDVRWLADSPILSTVERLQLSGSHIDAAGLDVLLASPHLGRLRQLALPYNHLDDGGIDVLIRRDTRGLTALDLSTDTFDDFQSGGRDARTVSPAGARRLAAWPGLGSVEQLVLHGQQILTEGLSALVGSPHLGALWHLGIRGISDWDWEEWRHEDVLEAFAGPHPELSLRSLELADCPITWAGADALDTTNVFSSLRALTLRDIRAMTDQIEAGPFRRLARHLQGLQVLSASEMVHGDTFWKVFLDGAPERLHTLRASAYYPWSRDIDLIDAIASGPVLPELRRLEILDVHLERPSLAALGTSAAVPELVALTLVAGGHGWRWRQDGPRIGEDDVRSFEESPLGRRLQHLELSETTGRWES